MKTNSPAQDFKLCKQIVISRKNNNSEKKKLKEITLSKFENFPEAWFQNKSAVLSKRIESLGGSVIEAGESVTMIRRDKKKIGIDILSKDGTRINSVFYSFLKV